MTRDKCETLCQPLKADVMRDDLDGYCHFGDNDLIWTHAQYQNADAQKVLLNVTNILGKEVSPNHFNEEEEHSTCAYQTGITAEGESVTSVLSLLMTRDECEDYCQPAKALTLEEGVWGYCVFGSDDYVWTYRYND